QPVDVQTLDPTTSFNSPALGSGVLNSLYDVLYTTDQEGNVLPGVATDFSTPDGLVWTLVLRDGVRFTDGTPFDADAVKTQWDRVRANPRTSGSSATHDVTAINVVDSLTLEVVLSIPNRQFHDVLALTNMLWIPSPTAFAAAGDRFGEVPVGAGPFVLQSRTPNSQTVLARNPDYWQEGLPMLDTLTFATVVEPQSAYDTLAGGGADAALYMPDPFAVQARDAGFTLYGTDQVGGSAWLFGSSRAPFDDPRAREAVYLALDMEDLNQNFANGASDVPTTFFPESSPFYNPEITIPEPDPVEAQRLLDELAAEGRPVSFTIVTTPGDLAQRAVYVQTQLSRFDNLDVAVETLDSATFGPTLFSGNFDMAPFTFVGIGPAPTVSIMRTSHPIPTASMGSPVIDEAVQEARTATDLAGQRAAYDRLTRELNELYRIKWIARDYAWVAMAPDVTGVTTYGRGSQIFTEFGFTV
ncbi:MAG TPA: ABC transporter substrate-binding protein, partial [Acidothermales bacterium]